MTEERLPSKFAFILHADVAGSTELVRQDEHVAHNRIQDTFRRFGEIITKYHGRVRELRGDALLAEFERASDAVTAALSFQADQSEYIAQLNDNILPMVRVGIAMGEVVVADNTITGDGVVLAQRLEQLAESGGVCIQDAAYQALPKRLPFEYEDQGEQKLKGFEEPVRTYAIKLKLGESIPSPETRNVVGSPKFSWKSMAAVVAVVLIVAGGWLAWWQPWVQREEPASVERMAFPLPDKPSIAVLPFSNLGGDPEQAYFADGITNDLITDLSRFNNLFVIAANSTFAYKGKPVKVQQVAEDLGVRYILEGSVQRAGDTIRVNAQLIDALSGHHIWADRYDRRAGDLFTIQNEIIKTIVGSLDLQVLDAEYARALKRPTDELKAYDNYQRGYAHVRAHSKEDNAKAHEWLQKTIELDPEYARAYSGLATLHWRDWRYDWIEDTSESLALALESARRAVALDPGDYYNLWGLGAAYLANGESESALSSYERALELNPHDPSLLMDMIEMLVSIGRAEQAVAQAETAIRYNPRHPDWYLWNLGWAQYFAGQYEAAEATLQKMTEPPNGVRRTLAPVLVRLGRIDEAREMIKEYMKNEPEQTVADIRKLKYKHRPYVDKWAEDLLVAGLPENPPLKLPDKPSIAVLPFDTLSTKGSDSHLADAMTETLIATLGQVPELFVIARNSTFTYKGKAVDVRQVGRELGVRHVLEGSVQQSGNDIRVTAQLIDATTGEHLWAERYDRPLDDFFALQDEIALKILVSLQGKLTEGADAALRSSSTDNVQAYLRFQEAMNVYFKRTKDAHIEARRLADAALELDPGFAMPKALKAWTHIIDVFYSYSESPENSLAAAEAEIDRIGTFEDESVSTNVESEAYMARATIALLRRQYDLALELGRKTIKLTPDYADLLANYGAILLYAGQPEDAVQTLRRAMRLSPQYESWQARLLSLASTLSGDHDTAVTAGKDAIDRAESDSNRAFGHLVVAIAHADDSMLELARDQVDRALELRSDMTIDRYRSIIQSLRNQSDVEQILGALRVAGLPE